MVLAQLSPLNMSASAMTSFTSNSFGSNATAFCNCDCHLYIVRYVTTNTDPFLQMSGCALNLLLDHKSFLKRILAPYLFYVCSLDQNGGGRLWRLLHFRIELPEWSRCPPGKF